MKRSALVRKTPMKRGTTQLQRSPMSRGLTGMLSIESRQLEARASKLPEAHKRARKAKGMQSKERPVTAAEKVLWGRMATEVGCIACLLDGFLTTYVSIHHIDGRTKPGCHLLVLPLCAPHHQQDDSDMACRIAVHPNKARFEARYGSQYELLALVKEKLGISGN
jgi:hypothetical protein